MRFSYPAPRKFPPWPYFTRIVVVLCVIFVSALITSNVALTGCETVSIFMSDFNITQSFWFDRFRPSVMKVEAGKALSSEQLRRREFLYHQLLAF